MLTRPNTPEDRIEVILLNPTYHFELDMYGREVCIASISPMDSSASASLVDSSATVSPVDSSAPSPEISTNKQAQISVSETTIASDTDSELQSEVKIESKVESKSNTVNKKIESKAEFNEQVSELKSDLNSQSALKPDQKESKRRTPVNIPPLNVAFAQRLENGTHEKLIATPTKANIRPVLRQNYVTEAKQDNNNHNALIKRGFFARLSCLWNCCSSNKDANNPYSVRAPSA